MKRILGVFHPRLTARTTRPPRRGQSLVELTLSLPLLLLLLLGTVDIGRAFFDYVQMRNAAREGAGYGAHFPNDTAGIEARVTRHGVPAGTTTSVSCSSCGTSGGVLLGPATITVTVQNTFTPITTGFLERFGLSSFTLTASASMRVLQ